MTVKIAALVVAGLGGLLTIPGMLLGTRLSDEDASLGLKPLLTISVEKIENRPHQATLVIPNTSEWTRLRAEWGEPYFVFSVIDYPGRTALCWDRGLILDVHDSSGNAVALQRGGPPYGYSAECEFGSLVLRAPAGSEFQLKLTRSANRHDPRGGNLIVMPGWGNTKDRLVGIHLERELESVTKKMTAAGVALLGAGGVLYFASRFRRPWRDD